MRTTLTLDDTSMLDLRRLAAREGISFKEAVNRVIRAGLAAAGRPAPRKGRRLPAFAMGFPPGGMDKALGIAAELENREIARKAALRK